MLAYYSRYRQMPSYLGTSLFKIYRSRSRSDLIKCKLYLQKHPEWLVVGADIQDRPEAPAVWCTGIGGGDPPSSDYDHILSCVPQAPVYGATMARYDDWIQHKSNWGVLLPYMSCLHGLCVPAGFVTMAENSGCAAMPRRSNYASRSHCTS